MFNSKTKFGMKENVEYQLKDVEGNIKPIFQANWLYKALMKLGLASRTLTSPLLGKWVTSMTLSNLIPIAGVAGIAARINGTGSPDAFTYIALGTGTTAAANADTKLESEATQSGGERAAATCSVVTTGTAGDTAQLTKTFNFTTGASYALTESGVLNAASDGTLLARQVFAAINVASGDSLAVTWKFDVSTS